LFSFLAEPGPLLERLQFLPVSQDEVRSFSRQKVPDLQRPEAIPPWRASYHPGYDSAFVLDPDGYNIEAVYHDLS
jgi:hypothetical protein